MIQDLRLVVVVDDSTSKENPDLLAKHGLCLLLDAKIDDSKHIEVILDTGPSRYITLHNMKMLGIAPQKIDAIMLSHGHYDHTGGLLGILDRIGGRTMTIAHPRTFDLKLKLKPRITSVGTPFRKEEVEKAGGALLCVRNPIPFCDGISTSGEIAREIPFERVDGFWTVDAESIVEDAILDDQALLINLQDKGLVVITGCAHAGVINTIKHAKKVMGIDRLYAVIGGFHLEHAEEERVMETVKELKRLSPRFVLPCHCTGQSVTSRLQDILGERCISLRTGDRVRL